MEQQNIQEPTSIKQMFQGMVPETIEVIQGTVISASPLKIQVINDEKLVLSENIICLPRHLSTYQTTVDITLGKGSINSVTREDGAHGGHAGGDGKHRNTLETFNLSGASMTVYNGLKVGETVYILSFNHGKKYYILDREAT